jgi:hypothetical protein
MKTCVRCGVGGQCRCSPSSSLVECSSCGWISACRTSLVVGGPSAGMVYEHSRRRTFSQILRDDIIIVSDDEDLADEEADSKLRRTGVHEYFLGSASESEGEEADDEDTIIESDGAPRDGADAGSIVAAPGMSPFSCGSIAEDADSDAEDSVGGWDGPAPAATKAASGWDEDIRWIQWADGDHPNVAGVV